MTTHQDLLFAARLASAVSARANAGAGLGALLVPRRLGAGALGPLGNRDSIAAGAYVSTGDAVNVRASAGGSVIGALNIGDAFQADGTVNGAEVNGVYTNFAHGTTGRSQAGWVAVEYLAPKGTPIAQTSASVPSGGGGGAMTPAAQGAITAPAFVTRITDFAKAHSTAILVVSGLAALGIVALAVMASGKKGHGGHAAGRKPRRRSRARRRR